LTDAMSLVPVKLRSPNRSGSQTNHSDSFEFTPPAGAILLL
jgi:hypothetical protein